MSPPTHNNNNNNNHLSVRSCCSVVCRASGTSSLVVLDAQYHQHCLVRIWHSIANSMRATSSTIFYNPPTPKSLPPYKPPSLPPGRIRHQKPHSQRKSLRAFRIFPYCRRLPCKNAACARFRRARKARSHVATPTPIALAAQFIAIKDIITAAKTVHLNHAQLGILHSRLGALIGRVEAVRPVLVTKPFHLPSTFRVHTFIPHSLAPDKSYLDNSSLSSWSFLSSYLFFYFGIAELAICSTIILVYVFPLAAFVLSIFHACIHPPRHLSLVLDGGGLVYVNNVNNSTRCRAFHLIN